jgi:tetrahydromethanopterin S-methyltransferase subunit B
MIEKLKIKIEEPDKDTTIATFPGDDVILYKINEIIDKVNQLEKAYNEEHYIQLDDSMKKEESDTPLTDAFIKIFDSFKEKESK